MKRNILLVFTVMEVLHLCVVSALAQGITSGKGNLQTEAVFTPPKGHSGRYVLPYFQSVAFGLSRSTTVINVFNPTTNNCDVVIQWQDALGTTDVCSINYTIPAGQSTIFCSRPISGYLADCLSTCPDSGLVADAGHAYISANSNCAHIAVDAQLEFTSDASDEALIGITKLNVINYKQGNKGD